MSDYTGEALDRLCTVEARNSGMPHNIVAPLYAAARRLTGDRPITMYAAEKLKEHVGKGDVVFIITGAGYPPTLPEGESDGPPGAAALARAIYRGLGAVPIFVLEKLHARPVIASAQALGVMVKSSDEAQRFSLGAGLEIAPGEHGAISDWATGLLDKFNPKAVISTERIGPGKEGILHSSTGIPFGHPDDPERKHVVDISPVVRQAHDRGILTIGIGDAGNEVGFGTIRDTVLKHLPRGEFLADTVNVDIVLPVMMSNWGCYGIEAALAFLLKQPDLMHTPELERRQIIACLEAGGIEAINCTMNFEVDGLDGETSMACVQILHNIVRKTLEPTSKGLAH